MFYIKLCTIQKWQKSVQLKRVKLFKFADSQIGNDSLNSFVMKI